LVENLRKGNASRCCALFDVNQKNIYDAALRDERDSNFSGDLVLLLCSCTGFRLPPEEPTDNQPRILVIWGYWHVSRTKQSLCQPAQVPELQFGGGLNKVRGSAVFDGDAIGKIEGMVDSG